MNNKPLIIMLFAIFIIVLIACFILGTVISNANKYENACKNQLVQVDSNQRFTCNPGGKVSQQVIDDVKYNVCTCKESK